MISPDEVARQLAMLRSKLEHCDWSEFPVLKGQIQILKYILNGNDESIKHKES